MGVLERLRRKTGHGSTDSTGHVDVDVAGGEGEEYVDDWSGLNDPSPWDTSPRRPSGPPRPGPRGWAIKGGGRASFVQPPQQMRGTTVQVCGLWPWATGAGAPMVGVPLGRHLFTGATVCCDPINWMRHTNLISAPSMFLLADPGLGKSKTVARMMLGLAGQGTVPMVLGDLRPDYVELITELGGQVIRLGPGRSVLNVLDPGETRAAVATLRQGAASARRAADARAARGEHDLAEGLRQRAEYRAKKANELEADAADRQVTMLTALVTINRGAKPITDGERVILERALALLAEQRGPEDPAPVLVDVYDVIESAPPELQLLTVNRGDTQRYQESTHDLLTSLQALINSELGRMLGGQTTEPIDLDAHPGGVVFDVSAISDINNKMQGAALMACWSAGFATINASWALSDAGLGPRRYFFAVLDELHRALRAGAGMVDRVDLLTRLNRRDGAGYVMVTHTMSDLQSMRDPEDVAKARGLIERSKILLIGGLSEREISGSEGGAGHPGLSSVVRFTDAEREMVTGWSTPTSWSTSTNQSAPPPGRGKFLIKVGQRPGIPIEVLITKTEQRISDTNARWQPDTQLENRLDEALSEDESEWS